ncbi:N-6 DNA methylase [Luteitalea sp.]|uniref:Eco57I restriction-modification methylase domain-containing protein n=1 Tax=Luteitalea sp. TaxID=2004800 RepID=UPI0025C2B5D8|nr:N-6 DNA methylase [Luteitalea sp.]
MSAPWVTGGRIWARVVERQLAAALLAGTREEAATRAMQRCMRVWRQASEALGPASGASAVWTDLVRPCADALGWSPGSESLTALGGVPVRVANAMLGPSTQVLVALPWGTSQDGLQRAATRLGAEQGAAWVAVCNGLAWRWYDATRPYARDHLGFDLLHASIDARVWQALWLLGQSSGAGRAARARQRAWIDDLVESSVTEAAGTTQSLRDGVTATLAQLSRHARGNHDDHVAMVFQWLFLLFAETRQLLPVWHSPYRRSYALSTIARQADSSSGPPLGVHESLAAIARLGRTGGRIGAVPVGALNGPLFAGTLASRRGERLADDVCAAMLAQLTHGAGRHGGTPIDFTHLGVEHLGSLYERLMAPSASDATRADDLAVRTPGSALLRKRTGAFYTPRLMADLLVERTLDPLVRGASSDAILGLRILDPAMGSGALLASALRYLVAAVEAAWVREGRGGPLDVARAEREALPRRIAEQCLHGVDVNARAVHVARLSVWLLSMAPDRPLTWLDAHLRVGNSLVGTSPATVLQRAPRVDRLRHRRHPGQLTLFDLEQWHHEAAAVAHQLEAITARPTDSAEDAHEKSRAFAQLRSRAGLAAWRARADAWCGAAMDAAPVTAGTWRAADDDLRLRGRGHAGASSPARHCAERWQALAQAQQCLHWTLEFPDVFDAGRGGFDAVIANPPWEMLRGDLGTGDERAAQRDDLGPLLRFVRHSGLYRGAGGHVNSYQLFLERMLQLIRPGGRIGCLLPGGVLIDHGAAALRRHLLDHAAVDRITVFDNREALFPIHRSLRIVSITGTSGASTDGVLVDEGTTARVTGPDGRPAAPRLLSRALLRQGSGEAEAIPFVRHADDLYLLQHLLAHPTLGDDAWQLRFGRELNATEDREAWRSGPRPSGGLPVVDGKHVQAFDVRPPSTGAWMSPDDAARALPGEPWRRWRLAYRDVSSPTNTRSLIAALLPPGCVTTHTLFCLQTTIGLPSQLYLCGMLNSLVADWFVRRYLGAHVTTRLMAHVPVPRVSSADARRRRIVRLTARLMRQPDDAGAQADLQVVAADLYGLGSRERSIVATDFARLPAVVRDRFVGGDPVSGATTARPARS